MTRVNRWTVLILALLLTLGTAQAVAAQEEPAVFIAGDYKYTLTEDGSAVIVKYTGREKDLMIPAVLDGHTVTEIGDEAFLAFGMTSVTIPDSVIHIGINPFYWCTKLTQITVSLEHPALAVIDGVLFSKTDKRLVCFSHAFTVEEYAIPQGVQMIGDQAFHNCDSLKSVALPDSVTLIGSGAFCGCDNLTSVTIPDSVIIIGDNAFSSCDSLTSVTIPDSVTSIGDNPFGGCKNLTQITVSPKHPALAVIDGVLFSKEDKRLVCYPIAFEASEYAIPQGVQIIGKQAFAYCSSLTSVTIPDSVTVIGEESFYSSRLTSVTIPNSVTDIGSNAFSLCYSLKSVTITDSVTVIGDNAFSYCKSLTSVTIPDSVTTIGDNPFKACKNLTQITVSPNHPALAVVEGVLFSKADKRLVCYPCAFSAVEYSIPQDTRIIGRNAFYSCTSLTSVTIPEGVTVIGDSAFNSCTSLTSVTILDNAITIGDDSIFSGLTIQGSETTIGDFAFCFCDNLTSVTLPTSVTAIGDLAFSSCPLLTLTVPRDSYAARYCQEQGLSYRYADALDWLKD